MKNACGVPSSVTTHYPLVLCFSRRVQKSLPYGAFPRTEHPRHTTSPPRRRLRRLRQTIPPHPLQSLSDPQSVPVRQSETYTRWTPQPDSLFSSFLPFLETFPSSCARMQRLLTRRLLPPFSRGLSRRSARSGRAPLHIRNPQEVTDIFRLRSASRPHAARWRDMASVASILCLPLQHAKGPQGRVIPA